MIAEKLSTRGGSAPPTDVASESATAITTPSPAGAHQIRWYGIAALPGPSLLESLCRLDLPPEVADRVRAGRPEYHVTLWHIDEMNKVVADGSSGPREVLEGVRAELAASVGQQAVVEVLAIDWSDSVIAAQVKPRSLIDWNELRRGARLRIEYRY